MRVLVALATVAAMLLSLAGFASAQFSDVDADADYADAVELLAELKVAQGYPDGTFGVNNNMTRQEFAAFVVRAMGREAMAQSFSNARTAFRDDAEIAPWARGYVYVATQARIINGYPDGTFRPNGQVTQAEAITMIVRALGFSAYAEKLGAWPTGYLLAAEELRVSDGLTVVAGLPMTRGEMAIALKNALAASYRYNANSNELEQVANGENSWLRKAHGYTAAQWREVAGDVTKVTGEFKRTRAGNRIELANGNVYKLHVDRGAVDVRVTFNDGDPHLATDVGPWDPDADKSIEEGDRVTLT
nr:hypothetical protein [Bacillota bacterium]